MMIDEKKLIEDIHEYFKRHIDNIYCKDADGDKRYLEAVKEYDEIIEKYKGTIEEYKELVNKQNDQIERLIALVVRLMIGGQTHEPRAETESKEE